MTDMEAKALEMRRQGKLVHEIAAELFPRALPGAADNKVHKILANAPRNLRFKGGELGRELGQGYMDGVGRGVMGRRGR